MVITIAESGPTEFLLGGLSYAYARKDKASWSDEFETAAFLRIGSGSFAHWKMLQKSCCAQTIYLQPNKYSFGLFSSGAVTADHYPCIPTAPRRVVTEYS